MRQTLLCIILCLGSTAARAHDDYPHPDQLPLTTVAEARRLADDSRIIVAGRIVRRLDDDEYLFSDGTATIRVEIDDDDWHRVRWRRRDRLLLWAEVDRDKHKVELDVARLRPAW